MSVSLVLFSHVRFSLLVKMELQVWHNSIHQDWSITVLLKNFVWVQYNILQKTDGMSSETMLLLWSMKEKHNCDSKFKYYFDTLPKEFNTGIPLALGLCRKIDVVKSSNAIFLLWLLLIDIGLSFGVDAIMALEGTLLLEEIMQAKEVICTLFVNIFNIFDHSALLLTWKIGIVGKECQCCWIWVVHLYAWSKCLLICNESNVNEATIFCECEFLENKPQC